MKIVRFPITRSIIRCLCDCGGEYTFSGFSLGAGKDRHGHRCSKCFKDVGLSDVYPKDVYEQLSDVGEEIHDS